MTEVTCFMTIKEIAKLAGVSISTVSKIVNNKDQNINSATRNRVLEIVKEYNYTPYGTVKDISMAKTFLIGVLLRDSSGFKTMLNGIVKAAQEQGYGILIFDSCSSSTDELKHITALCKNKIDGLLWEPAAPESMQHEHYFTEAGIPVVYVNSPYAADSCGSSSRDCESYTIDYQRLGYLCTEKLIQWRHHKIGCLIQENSLPSFQVFEGMKNCLFDHHLSLQDGMAFHLSDSACIATLTSGKITGIVSSSLGETLSLYRQLDKMHYHIPSDFSLIGLCGDETGSLNYPPVSNYRIPYWNLGYEACRALIDICEKNADDSPGFSLEAYYVLNHEESINTPASCRGRKFVVLGSINTDVTLTVDGFPETGKSTLITNSSSCAGGKGTNQSMGSAKLGHEAVLIGKVGNDADASLIFDTLNQNHLLTEGIYKDQGSQTGKAYVYVQNDGEVTITYIPGANLRLTADDVRSQKALFEGCEYLLLSMDIPMEAAMEAASLAKKFSGKTILKPSALSTLPEVFYRTTDIFVPNQQEAATFCPQIDTVEGQAEYFYNRGMPVVIITLGHGGCYVRAENLQKHFPSADFTAVDATGGADAFISALAVHLSDGYPLEKSVRIAQYAAGFCVSRQGVTTALVDKDTLYLHIGQAEPDLLSFK